MGAELDPIVAIATPPGRGAIGIVRLTGADLRPIVHGVLESGAPARLKARRALFCRFVDDTGATIDEGLALLFPGPRSYTGQTVLELQGHGGPVVLQALLSRCLDCGRGIGLRLAEPGEFTRRAYLNDRLDLAQAEAVADLIDASTAVAARAAARSLTGEFSRAVHALIEALIDLRTLVEATLDFPDEGIDFLERADVRGRIAAVRGALDDLVQRSRQGAVLREGMNVVLVGAPNVGKSSLLNALAGEEVAIVTAVPGTTRDRISQRIQVGGIPLNIIDTAGLRDTADEVERLGIGRTLAAIEHADVVLHVVDAGHVRGPDDTLARVRERLAPGVPLITVCNKIDLANLDPGASGDRVWLSAKTGAGIEGMRARLMQVAGWSQEGTGETVVLARERHLQALALARDHLAAAAEHAEQRDAQLELLAEELRLAGQRLSDIGGEFTPDALLGRIFARFCIGK
ncbi:MAG TPA: tRNA uridine-5-carboxymethylaminomethyl(34) synthesis GTPase MnmE [Burkholderiaceae bacterium]|nr:tRNA uridine-5-carboxymethylaminomethyl(34) synthesis GTPase MnmE [Burkholderiaceae bacterium]